MSVIIEVTSTEIKTRSGTSQRTGNAYTMREQIAYLHKGEAYPEKIRITLEDNQPPYMPGNYDLSPASFYVDKYDSLSVRPVLMARPAETQQQATSVPAGIKRA